MATTIGNLAVILSANVQPALDGFKKVQGGVKATAGTVASASARMAAVGTAAAGILGVPLTLAGVFAAFKSGVNDIMALDMQARQLGVSITELKTVLVAAGDSGIGAMAHLKGMLYDAQTGSLEASRAFQHLEVISGKAFSVEPSGLPINKAMEEVIGRIARIEDTTQRTRTGLMLFGDAWRVIGHAMQQGAGPLQRAAQAVKNLGLGVESNELQAVRQVARAFKDIGLIFEGAKRTFTLAIAPIAAELAKLFDPTTLKIAPWKDTILSAIETVAKALAGMIDLFINTEGIKAAWSATRAFLEQQIKLLAATFSEQIAEFHESFGRVGMAKSFRDRAAQQRRQAAGLGVNAEVMLGSMMTHFNSGGVASRWMEEFFKRVRGNTGGGTGATPGLSDAAGIGRTLQQFGSAVQSVTTPLETFQQVMRDINLMASQGAFAAFPELQARMMAKAMQDFASAQQLPSYQPTGLVQMFSREAASAVVRAQMEGLTGRAAGRMTVQDTLKALQEEANRMQAEQLRIGRETADAIKTLYMKIEVKGF